MASRYSKQGYRKRNMQRLALLVALTIMLPACQPAVTVEESTAVPVIVRSGVVALGRVEPQGEVISVSGPAGQRLAQLDVQVGERVEANQVLGILDSYAERLAERDLAVQQLAEAEVRLQAEIGAAQADIAVSRSRLAQAEQPRAFEITAQEATIRRLDAELTQAQTDLERLQQLARDGAISQQNLETQQSLVQQLEAQRQNAQEQLEQLGSSRSTDIATAQAQVQAAEANLARARTQVGLDSARAQVDLAEARLANTLITVPQAGQILRIVARPGEAISQSNPTILELGDTDQMMVVAEVYESDIGLVQLGQQAEITSRNGAFDETLTGEVTEIGYQIFKNNILDDDPAANADARVVEVKIRLDQGQTVATLTNLQVDARILLDNPPNAAATAGGTE